MQVPLEIVFHNVDRSAAVEAAVRERAAKLEEFAENITSCRVAIEAPHKHHRQGNLYTGRVDLRFPGGEAVANRSPSANHTKLPWAGMLDLKLASSFEAVSSVQIAYTSSL